MTNLQLYFAIGVPTFAILCSLIIGIFQLNHAVNQINLRFTSLENRVNAVEARMDSRMAVIESDLKTIVRLLNDMDVRIARLEERATR